MTNFYFVAHMFGLVLLSAGIGIANLSGIRTGMAKKSSEIAMWSGINHKTEHVATLPGALILLVTGVLMVDDRGFDFGAFWISAAFALWVLAVILGAGVLGRHSKKVHRAASEAAAAGREDDEAVVQLSTGPLGPIVGNLLNLIMIAFLYLMVYKPGA
jgi:uncharacterized membrane protein